MKLLFRQRSIEAQAADWLVQSRSQGFDAAQDRRLTHWLDSDPRHEEAFVSAQIAWALSEDLADSPKVAKELTQILSENTDLPVRRSPSAAALTPKRLVIAFGTLAVLAAMIGLFLRSLSPALTFHTAVGEQRTLQLPDGSTATLNTATDILVRFTRSTREIHLLQGEALFNAAHDRRPFIVRALSGAVTDTGTQFDVNQRDSNTVTVSVLEGTVRIANVRADRGLATGNLRAGEALDYRADGSLSTVRPADTTQIQAWLAHRIVFSDVSLAEAVQQYNRYAQLPLILAPNAPAERKISGVFRIGDEDAFVRALEQQLRLKARKDAASSIVLDAQ
jgi:transmembrane sensor